MSERCGDLEGLRRKGENRGAQQRGGRAARWLDGPTPLPGLLPAGSLRAPEAEGGVLGGRSFLQPTFLPPTPRQRLAEFGAAYPRPGNSRGGGVSWGSPRLDLGKGDFAGTLRPAHFQMQPGRVHGPCAF